MIFTSDMMVKQVLCDQVYAKYSLNHLLTIAEGTKQTPVRVAAVEHSVHAMTLWNQVLLKYRRSTTYKDFIEQQEG